jgi:hypothetical protein
VKDVIAESRSVCKQHQIKHQYSFKQNPTLRSQCALLLVCVLLMLHAVTSIVKHACSQYRVIVSWHNSITTLQQRCRCTQNKAVCICRICIVVHVVASAVLPVLSQHCLLDASPCTANTTQAKCTQCHSVSQ